MDHKTYTEHWHRLEVAAVTRSRTGGSSGYGFALLQSDNGDLVATGCGPAQPGVTHNQAAIIAALQGLEVARQLDVKQLTLQTDSAVVHKQLQRAAAAAGPGVSSSSQLLAAAVAAMSGLRQLQVHAVDRRHNGLAIIQAEFALQLLQQLREVAAAAPSKYSQVAGQLARLLQLPLHLRRVLETADDFVGTAAEVAAARCGASAADILAALHPGSGAAGQAAVVAAELTSSACSEAVAGEQLQLVPRLVPFSMGRLFTAQEGAAYAAAAAAQAQGGSPTDDHCELAPELAAALESGEGLEPPAAGSGRLADKSLTGRHRLQQRLLVVGLHDLPGDWEPGQPLQQAGGSADAGARHGQTRHGTAAAGSQQSSQLQQQIAGAAVVAAPAAFSSTGKRSRGIIVADEDDQLPSWAVVSSAAGSSEGGGLGTSRYQLPHVNSDTATHLLQFDGASRGNPGRAGYGWVLFDLASGRLAGRGCMSLPYRHSSGQAEFEGLLAGLRAAQEAGVVNLAVQGDSALVLDALMYRRGISSREITVLYHKATQLLTAFEHVDFQFIPREQNSLADRLAQMSMDIDTALHVLLRKGEGGLTALQTLTKAARLAKRQHVLEALLSHSFPVLLVVLLQRVMSISPEQLLARLQAKAQSLGDPNPWLVQEVAKVVEARLPEGMARQLGSILLDSRYTTAGTRTRLRGALATAAAARQQKTQQAKQQQQQQQDPAKQYVQQQATPPDAAVGPRGRGFCTWPAAHAASAVAAAARCQQPRSLQQPLQLLALRQRQQPLPRISSSAAQSSSYAVAASSRRISGSSSSIEAGGSGICSSSRYTRTPHAANLQHRCFSSSGLDASSMRSQRAPAQLSGWQHALHCLRLLRRCLH